MKIDVMEYFKMKDLGGKIPVGSSQYAPLILLVNNEKKIVEELLEESDCYYKYNLLSFLDQALYKCLRAKEYGQQVYDDIIWVLQSYKNIKEKVDKPEYDINFDEFIKYLKENQ